MSAEIQYNETNSRYEKDFDGHVAYANTRKIEGFLYIDYVFAPKELRGTGAAGKLMAALMDVVRNENLKAKPICGYAVSWLRKNNDKYSDIIE